MNRVLLPLRMALLALTVSILLGTPSVALAEDPPDEAETVFSAGFESADASITLRPTPSISSSAYWGRITGSKRTGSYGLWCAGSTPSNWDPYSPTYPVDTRGQALIDMAVLADYYDSWLEYYYILPSRGGGDANSFNVGWWANGDPGDWDTYNYFGLTSTWKSRTEELSNPYNSPGLSREAATVIFEFNDKVDAHGASVGQGATVDDVTITGYMFGPARSLAATAGSTSVPLSWTEPWASRDMDAVEDRSVTYRVWRRSYSPAAGSWQEVTSGGGQSATSTADAFPPAGVDLEYRVHVWEDGGSGYSEATTVAVDQPPAVTDDAVTDYIGTAAEIAIEATDTVDGVGAIYYVLDGGTTQTVAADSTLVTVSQWGDHVLTYWATDGGGTSSDPVTREFTVDTAPSVSDDAPSGYSTSSPTTVTITAVANGDGVGSISYALDGAATQTVLASSVSVGITGESQHTLSYFASSDSGDVSDVETAQFTIDSVAPATTDDAPNGWQTSAVDVTLTPSDATSGPDTTYYRIGGGSWETYSSAVSVSADGTTTIEYYSTDVAGNTEGTQSCTVQIDTVAPSTDDDAPAGWQTSAVDVTLTPSDATSGMGTTYFVLNGGAEQTYSGPLDISAEGTTTIAYASVDVAGNREATQTAVVKVDTVAPATSDDAPSGWQTSAVDVTLAPSDATSGVFNTYYNVNSTGWNTYGGPISVVADGVTTIDYYSTDVAGNIESQGSCSVQLDTVVPSTSDDAPTGWQTSAVDVTLTPSDATSGIDTTYYRVGGGSWQAYSSAVPVSADGTTTIEYYSTDVAGNTESAGSCTVELDTEVPTVTDDIASPYLGSAFFTLSASDGVSGVDSISYRIDSGSTTEVPGDSYDVSVSLPGTRTIEYWTVDVAGNESAHTTEEFRVGEDEVPPITSITAPEYTQNDPESFTVEATDEGIGVRDVSYRVDGAATITVAAASAGNSVSGEGTHTIEYWAADDNGNTSAVKTHTLVIDHTVPATTDDAPVGWQTAAVDVTLSPSDAISGVDATYYTVNGGGEHTYASPISVSDDGTTTIAYASVDRAGNREATQTATVMLDTTAPSTTDDAPSGWQTSPVDVTLTPSDATSGIDTTYYRINSGSLQTYATPISVTADGVTTIEYYSTDVAGNTESAGSCTVQLDMTAPSTSDDAPSGWQTSAVDVTLTPSDATSGIDTTYYRVNSGSWQTYSSAIPVSADGTTTIEYYSEDAAGNTESADSCTVQLDTTAPSTTDNALPGWQTSPVDVTLTPSDATSGIDTTYYRINSGSLQTYATPISVTADGVTTIEYYSTDVAGNTESAGSCTVQLDTTAPASDWDGTATYYGSATITLSASDVGGSGVDLISYSLDGGAEQTYSAPIELTTLKSYTLEFWATDAVGHEESPHNSESFTIRSGGADRLADDNRFSTAVEIAREGFGGGGSDWTDVADIVIASGDDQFAADPLSASGLSWTYDAPLFLVSAYRSTPNEVLTAVKEIARDNGSVTVHVVGGIVSAPDARYNEIRNAINSVSGGSATKDRVAGSDRYATAEEIAKRVIAEYGTRNGGAKPPVVLVANGANPASFYDALALSPIAAANGYPILPVAKDSIPSATSRVLNTIKPSTAVIGGGTAVVTNGVKSDVDKVAGTVERWSGNDRYATSVTIADKAVNTKGWLDATYLGVAAGLPDALTGGSMVGSKGGPLVLTSGTSLTSVTGNWIVANNDEIAKCYIFGGTAVVKPAVKTQIESKLMQ